MARNSRNPSRRLAVLPLEDRVNPTTTFQILTLGSTGGTVVEHSGLTGNDQGALALSSSKAFITGTTATARFNLSDLSGGTADLTRLDALVGNLHDQSVYDLGVNGLGPAPLTNSQAQTGANVQYLLGVDPATGNLTGTNIPLTDTNGLPATIFVTNGTGLFDGYDRIVVSVPNGVTGTDTVYQIDLTTGNAGKVSVLSNATTTPPHTSVPGGFAYHGTAEHATSGADFLDFVEGSTTIARENVTTSAVTTLASFTDLGNMAAFTADLTDNRWYFHNGGNSQFHFGSLTDEVLGYEPATFQVGDFVVTNLNDSGAGSLRAVTALAAAAGPNNIVTFQTGLNGTINLSGPITVAQNVDIEGPGAGSITVAGTGSDNLFTPSNGVTLKLHGLTLSNPAGLTVGYPLDAAGDLAITAGSGDVTFTNTLSVSSGSLSVTDGNAVALGTATTVAGLLMATNQSAGFNVAAGDSLDGTGSVFGVVADAGTLGGTLTINGNVTVAATGKVSPGPSAATLTVNGNLQFVPGGKFAADFDGNGNNDQIAVNGTVDIGATGNILSPTFGYAPTPGDSFVLIKNDATDPLAGMLNGVRNRSGEQLSNGEFFQVRYDGGTGNDLELVTNTAPVLNTSVKPKLDPITENVPPESNTGSTVDSLVGTGNLYSDAQGYPRFGLAFTGADTVNGTWQFSRDAGAHWTNFGTLSDTSATLLEADGNGQNMVRFEPALNFAGSSTITFKAWDTTNGLADGSTGADATNGGLNQPYSAGSDDASVAVLAVDQPPVPVNDSYTTAEDTPLSVNATAGVLTNDTDPDGPFPLTAAIVDGPAHAASFTLNSDGSFNYSPAANFNGTDSFTYKAFDGKGQYGVGVATITVTPVNDAPTVVNDTATAVEDGGAVVIDVLNNDSTAPDTGETLTITAVTQPQHGSVSIINGGTKVSYTPNPLYSGPDSFTYTVTDNGTTNGSSDPKSATGSVAVTVLFVNHPPVAHADAAAVTEDLGAQAIDVLANDTDVDPGDTVTVTGVGQGLHGTVAIGPNGSDVIYTPAPEFAGTDQFMYTITDAHGGTSNAIVNVTVNSDLDDRLEVDPSAGTTVFTEKVPPPSIPVAIDPNMQIGPGSEGVITGATVRITSGGVAKKDVLVFTTYTNPANGTVIKGAFTAGNLALNLTGNGTQADYTAALRSVLFVNRSPAPIDGFRQIGFQLKDAAGPGPVAYKYVQVIGVDTAPVLSPATAPKPVNFTLGKPAVAVAGTLKITDLDNTRLQGATVGINPADFQLQDVLTAVTTKTGITASYNTSTGVLTLTGSATLATYLKVLKSVKFSTTTAGSGNRTLSIQVTDGQLQSNVVTRALTIS